MTSPLDQQASVAARLGAHGAALFGLLKGCPYSDRMREEWAEYLPPAASTQTASGLAPITFVPCDGGAQAEELCRAVGITMTPTLIFAGMSIKGYTSPAAMMDLVNLAPKVSGKLHARQTVLYGRDSCAWTGRQKKVLGLSLSDITYVNCEADAKRCEAAGVAAVPAFSIDASPPIYGYRKLPELSGLAVADRSALAGAAAASSAAVAGGKAAVTVFQ